MKSVFKALLIAATLTLSHTTNAAVVENFIADSEKGKAISLALREVNQYFSCTDSRSKNSFSDQLTSFTHYGSYATPGAELESRKSVTISVHDNTSPLLEIKFLDNNLQSVQLLLYTNKEMTSVTRILRRSYEFKQVNKGTLAKPNIQTEKILSFTVDCRPAK